MVFCLRWFIFCWILVVPCLARDLKATEIPRKKLAGPPNEFADHVIPDVLQGALSVDSVYLPMTFVEDGEHLTWKTDIFVDSPEEFTLSVFSPIENLFNLKLKDPQGTKINLEKFAVKGFFPIGETPIPETTYRFTNPKVGNWKFKVSIPKSISLENLEEISVSPNPGAIIVWNKSPTKLHSHLQSYSLTLGEKIGILSSITEDSIIVPGVRPNALKDVVDEAELEFITPDGQEVDVPMHDDGLHFDFEPNDGIYGASITATKVGVYQVSAYMSGTKSDGTVFFRSSEHLIPVVTDDIELTDVASGLLKDKDIMNIQINVQANKDMVQNRLFRAYAQVWGKDASGSDVPVCWIGGMVDIRQISSQFIIELELNLNWLAHSGAEAPLTLKEVVIQETSSFIPVSQKNKISVKTSPYLNKYLKVASSWNVTEITKEMRQGIRTRPLRSSNSTASRALILVHGYCSATNPWQQNSKIFTDAAFFLNANSNLNNEDFATKVYNWAENNGFTSYGLLGHSQGGMVGLHLLNYFETGMDDATGGKVLQSLGTPYQGCSAAGSAASLGKLFGVGCGSNTDLSTDGAKLWLAGISKDTLKHVSYYTTTYETGKFFGDWCNLAMNALLEWPNDGTTEKGRAQLVGATNMGNTEKQCHTAGMGYVAQYLDNNRNAVMNAAAAR